MCSILLVTGSRSPAENRSAEAWAWDIITRAIAELPLGSYVVTGDAIGPDRWATERARRAWILGAGVHHLIFRKDGSVDGHQIFWWLDPASPRPRTRSEWKERLLARDRAMVEWVRRQEGEKLCLALIDPRSRTRGAEYTAREAERVGIVVRREVRCG